MFNPVRPRASGLGSSSEAYSVEDPTVTVARCFQPYHYRFGPISQTILGQRNPEGMRPVTTPKPRPRWRTYARSLHADLAWFRRTLGLAPRTRLERSQQLNGQAIFLALIEIVQGLGEHRLRSGDGFE